MAPQFLTASRAARGAEASARGAQAGMIWQEAKDILRYPESYSEEQVEEASRVVARGGKVNSRDERWIFWLSLGGLAAISIIATLVVKRVRIK